MADKKKKTVTKTFVHYLELLYMTPQTITAKDIAAALKGMKEIKLQLWEEMNVLELELPSQNSVDLEPLELAMPNPSDAAFIEQYNIKTMFAVTLTETDLPVVKACFKEIIDVLSGFLCADTTDFNPIYVGTR